MGHEIACILTAALLLLSGFRQDLPQKSLQSDRQKAGYFGNVRKVSVETQILSRKLYREATDGSRELLEDTTQQFGGGRGLTEEDEFDENGRRTADASSDREMEQEPFRGTYTYDEKGRVSEEHRFNRDGSPAGKTLYVYNATGSKTEEFSYAANGILSVKSRYDDHENVIDIESYGPDGSITQKQTIAHSYRRDGNTLEDSCVISYQSDRASGPNAMKPQLYKTVYTYDDSGQLIKENSGGMEKSYDSKGRLSMEVIGNTRISHLYDEQEHEAETLIVEPEGVPSLSGGAATCCKQVRLLWE